MKAKRRLFPLFKVANQPLERRLRVEYQSNVLQREAPTKDRKSSRGPELIRRKQETLETFSKASLWHGLHPKGQQDAYSES